MFYEEVPDPLENAARKLFGLSWLFPYQRLVVSNILEAAEEAGIKISWPGEDGQNREGVLTPETDTEIRGENTGRQIVILPTGAGKSLCFQLPAMLMEGVTLVIYPLLGLMSDQERRLSERGFKTVTLRGGQNNEEREEIRRKLRAGKSKFVIANPEVLLTGDLLPRLKELGIIHIVIDEAHCVSEWGESFRPSYLEIGRIIREVAPPLVTAFTATAGAEVLQKIEAYIFGGPARRIVGNPDRKNIRYSARGCIVKNAAVRDVLLVNPRPAVVFCSSRPGTENLARYLRNEFAEIGLPWRKEIRFYHAGLSREEKAEIENWFFRSGGDAVLAATCAYGLGIDKADIRTVIHRDIPPSVEAYLQESGRAGRDGNPSEAVLLWGPEDTRGLERAKTGVARKRVSALMAYAGNTGLCRREALLKLLDYEGENDSPGPRCCDVCEGKARENLREEEAVTDFFHRNRRRYTCGEASKVLAGAETVRWTEEDAREVIAYLLQTGKLKQPENPLWKGRIQDARRPIPMI